jgi:hypothetical protein
VSSSSAARTWQVYYLWTQNMKSFESGCVIVLSQTKPQLRLMRPTTFSKAVLSQLEHWRNGDRQGKACSTVTLSSLNPTKTVLGLNPGLISDKPAPGALAMAHGTSAAWEHLAVKVCCACAGLAAFTIGAFGRRDPRPVTSARSNSGLVAFSLLFCSLRCHRLSHC